MEMESNVSTHMNLIDETYSLCIFKTMDTGEGSQGSRYRAVNWNWCWGGSDQVNTERRVVTIYIVGNA